jgi:hypothetical protein
MDYQNQMAPLKDFSEEEGGKSNSNGERWNYNWKNRLVDATGGAIIGTGIGIATKLIKDALEAPSEDLENPISNPEKSPVRESTPKQRENLRISVENHQHAQKPSFGVLKPTTQNMGLTKQNGTPSTSSRSPVEEPMIWQKQPTFQERRVNILPSGSNHTAGPSSSICGCSCSSCYSYSSCRKPLKNKSKIRKNKPWLNLGIKKKVRLLFPTTLTRSK